MASYNRVILAGNLTRDPEHKQLASGQAVCRLGLAVNRQFKNRQTGEMVQEVCYVDIDVWGAQAESCNQYLSKGRGVLVEGRLKFDNWEDANGQNRSKLSVVADRVVFLNSSAAEQDDENSRSVAPTMNAARVDTATTQALQEQLDQATASAKKTVKKAKKQESGEIEAVPVADAGAPASGAGEVKFKDQPPFEDDLPF